MRYACVFAHLDDEMRCLGTLLRLHEQGHEIAFVTLTGGDKGLPFSGPDSHERAVAVREVEIRHVAKAFDASYLCLGREDGFLYDDEPLRHDLIAALRTVDPEVVFTHWTNDYNADHVVTAKAVVDTALWTNLGSFEPHVPANDHVPRIYHVDTGAGYGFEATHFVELTADHVARKAELIRAHASQMDVMRRLRGHDYADEMADSDRVTGARLMVAHAEGFRPCLAERRIPWPSDLPGRSAPAGTA
ncbi:PIG-L deacetylase family protein [Actinopolymorpha singaporensis]|uniref:N-acetylglucosaminyl deacetylase, LmbE family n=1 Tax=Actinopolymorpha singaporensis TaxID=117157 RepID=A0A1H1R992_9ACTN|nr:PIG-L deacetylase family protein [Actinopolymorpha singaporensis]SDS32268.1 N-acetylglucosaminyl deacetylase, LmbE family [Actinopolymorpha singaporensis]